jgi:hypothetical protein
MNETKQNVIINNLPFIMLCASWVASALGTASYAVTHLQGVFNWVAFGVTNVTVGALLTAGLVLCFTDFSSMAWHWFETNHADTNKALSISWTMKMLNLSIATTLTAVQFGSAYFTDASVLVAGGTFAVVVGVTSNVIAMLFYFSAMEANEIKAQDLSEVANVNTAIIEERNNFIKALKAQVKADTAAELESLKNEISRGVAVKVRGQIRTVLSVTDDGELVIDDTDDANDVRPLAGLGEEPNFTEEGEGSI